MPVATLPQLSFTPYIQAPDLAPTNEYGNILQQSNQRYNDNIAQSDALDEHISQLGNTINSVDQPILDSLNKDTRDALTNIKTNGNWEDADVPIRMVAKRLMSDPALTAAQQNKTASDRIDALKEQAQAEGHHIIQYQDYKNTPTQNPDGTFNKITGDGVFDKRLDYSSKMQQLFSEVQPDSYSSKDSQPVQDADSGQIYQIGSGSSRRFVSAKKIADVTNRILPNYLNSDEGAQRLKVLTTSNSENQQALDHRSAINQIKKELLDVGLNKVFSDTSSDNSERLQKPSKGIANPNDGTVLMSDTAQPETADFGSWLDALDKKRRVDYNQPPPNFGGAVPLDAGSSYGTIPDKYKEANSTLFSYFSKITGSKDQAKINPMIKAYLTNNKDQMITPMVHVFSDPKLIEAKDKFMKNGAINMMPLIDNQGRVYTSTQDAQFAKDHPDALKKENIDNAKMVGYYSENNPYSELAGSKGSQFVAPSKVSIGNESFVAGSIPEDTRSPDYISKYLGNKITLSDRLSGKLPVTFTNSSNTTDKVQVLSKGDGSYIIQGKDKSGKQMIIPANDVNAAKTILFNNGYTKAEQ